MSGAEHAASIGAGAGEPRAAGLRWAVAIGLGGAALLAVVIADSARLIGGSFPGFLVWDNGTVVAFHRADWTGPIAGVPPTGRVLEVDGRPFSDGSAFLAHAASVGAGSEVSYRVRHRGLDRNFAVPTMRLSWAGYLSTFGIYLGNAALLFVAAAVAMALRPDRAAARAVALAGTAVGVVLALAVDLISSFRFVPAFTIAETLLPAAIAQLAVAFPLERTSGQRHRWAIGALAVALLGLGLVQIWLFRSNPELYERINAALYIALSLSLLGLLAGFGRELLRSPSPEARMQAAIVFAGAIAAAAPAAVLIGLIVLLDWSISYTWIVAPALFLPASVLYAAVVRDLLQAERFIRLTVGYALASAGALLAYTTTLVAFDRFLLAGASRHPAALFGAMAALAVAMDPIRTRVQRGIDRGFFRTSVDVAAVLERTSAEFAELREEAAIREHAADTLERELALEWAELASDEVEVHAGAALEVDVEFRGDRLARLLCGPKRSGAPFSAREHELVRGLAAQTALALQNARSLRALREAQEDLLRSERFAAIGEVASAVAHGIRNPLAGIRAAAQLAREMVDAAAAPPLQDIVSEVDRLDTRVRTLVELSRPYEARPEHVDLAALLREVAGSIEARARTAGVAVHLDLPSEPTPAQVDPYLLEEAVQELAGNALHALGGGGELHLALSADPGALAIRVRDTGKGIPEAVQGRIFDLFFTTRPDGTGMGLAAVKRAVESLGGRVTLESSEPGGTCFRIDVPQRRSA